MFTKVSKRSLPRVAVERGVYTLPEGRPVHTLLFCFDCRCKFFDGKINDEATRLAYIAAEQVALSHGKDLRHSVHRADPERMQ